MLTFLGNGPCPVLLGGSGRVQRPSEQVGGVGPQLLGGAEMCMPGDNIEMEIELITPIAMENGLRFAIREGGRTVGAGVVIKIIL